ncbi:MAG: hypothetical protein J07HQX50_01509 [Haloquadratum sp. J07HQX50]|nr:MAG: hypothetical protein J07HQX50_01509 [Haloquadratum sp. J07HQX50]
MSTDTESLFQRARLSRLGKRLLTERLSSYWLMAAGYLAIALFTAITFLLFYRSLPILSEYSLAAMLTSANWDPARNSFGFYQRLLGRFM